MRIQHNIMAMNAYRNYSNNVSAMKANLEKLSSGYKINRAGDDAAGLAISEKMRAQITGLETAQKNAKDGISLVQTAEGALTEVHDMLNRMVELATQSANGTYDNETDRYQLQKEMDQLRAEINRIADSANFNGIKLLDGSMDGSVVPAGLNDVSLTIKTDGQLAKTPQAGIYSVDFSNTTIQNKVTVASTTDNGNDVPIYTAASATFKIFGKTLTLQSAVTKTQDASKAWTKLEGEDLAKAVADAWNAGDANNGNAKWTLMGVEVKAEAKGDKVVFTMQSAPDSVSTLDASTGLFGGTGVTQNNAHEVTITQEQEASGAIGRLYGQASATFQSTDFVDGMTLKIGDTTYVAAVGATSKYADAENVIDLTDQKAGSVDLQTALLRLSEAAKDNKNFKVGVEPKTGKVTFTEKEGGVDYNVNNLAGSDGKGTNNPAGTLPAGTKATTDDWKGLIQKGITDTSKGSKALTLQIGDTAEKFNQLKVSIGDCHTSALGIANISIADQESAASAIDAIKAAINKVSDVRGTLGATQNRLDHTINNLSVMTENIQDAESTIRDVDVAEEMMAYTKNNILIQSAQAMLAQANQVPQGVLQLLQ